MPPLITQHNINKKLKTPLIWTPTKRMRKTTMAKYIMTNDHLSCTHLLMVKQNQKYYNLICKRLRHGTNISHIHQEYNPSHKKFIVLIPKSLLIAYRWELN